MNSTKVHFILGQNQQLSSTLSHLPVWHTSDWRAGRSGPMEADLKICSLLRLLRKRPFPSRLNRLSTPLSFLNICCESSATLSHEWPGLAVAPSMVKRLDPIWQESPGKWPVWQLGSSQWLQMAPESSFHLDPAQDSLWVSILHPHLPEPPPAQVGEEAGVSGEGQTSHATSFMQDRCV